MAPLEIFEATLVYFKNPFRNDEFPLEPFIDIGKANAGEIIRPTPVFD